MASRGGRQPRDYDGLLKIKAQHPELSPAVDMQIELLEAQHRIRSRIPVPWIEFDADWLRRQQEAGHPLLRFEDIPLDWTNFRRLFRETADVLRRYEALDAPVADEIHAMTRAGDDLQQIVMDWFNRAAAPEKLALAKPPQNGPEMLGEIIRLAMRPFLARCAETVQPRTDFRAWSRGVCPLCGGDPELAMILADEERRLVCGRCTAAWPHRSGCPFCGTMQPSHLTSFMSHDGHYRLYGCLDCKRYLKAVDTRRTGRPVSLAVDSVMTLPLDAAAMQKGFIG